MTRIRSQFFPLAVLLIAIAIAAPLELAAQSKGQRSAEFSEYFQYLNYHRSRIDAEFHPDPARRAPAAEYASSMAPKFAKFDVDGARAAILTNETEWRLVLNHLGAETSRMPELALQAQAELAVARSAKGAEQLEPEALKTLEGKARWLEQRSQFFLAEQARFEVGRGTGQGGIKLYNSMLALEEKRIASRTETDEKKRLIAAAAVELQEKEFGATTLEEARSKLAPRDLSLALRRMTAQLKLMPRRLDELAFHPVERDKLLAKKALFEKEIEALATQARDARRVPE